VVRSLSWRKTGKPAATLIVSLGTILRLQKHLPSQIYTSDAPLAQDKDA
jgi:hypothetical protein